MTRRLDRTLTTDDGHQVDAIATRPAEALAALAHGAGAGMRHAFMEQVADGLARRRMACLR